MRKLAEFSEPNIEIIDAYFKHMHLIGKKERTIYGESWNLKPFFDFLQGRPVQEIGRGEVEEYIIKRKRKVSPTTVHNGIISLRSFFKWLKPGNDFFTGIKSKQPKNNLPVDELLLPQDVITLRDAANNQRDRALVMLLWDSAARKSELLNINIGNVQFDKFGAVIIVNGKTGKRRIRLIDSVPDLQLWLNMHPLRNDSKAPLFITDRKYEGNYRRLNEQTVNNMLNGLAERTELTKNVYPHAFRHGRLTDLAKRGFNEMELRIFAGWTKESNMPATYLHLSGADIEKKILQKNGIIEDDTKEREERLKPIDCPRCKTRNPVGAKYCMTCSLVLDHMTALSEESLEESLKDQLQKDPEKVEELLQILKNILTEGPQQ